MFHILNLFCKTVEPNETKLGMDGLSIGLEIQICINEVNPTWRWDVIGPSRRKLS
jgi:hypothetical protein